jgi:hypothetical protein
MFYTEEDVEPAVVTTIELFGPAGGFSEDRNALKSISIATREFGKLWYGDVDKGTLTEKCVALSAKLNQKVYVFELHSNFDYDNSPCFPGT